jgi:transposase
MLRETAAKQEAMQMLTMEQLIPQDHLLRQVDRSVDFTFIRGLCKDLYSPDNGRPAIEPELLFRMLFIGYLYGVRSERRLEEEIRYNFAYRWFCGLNLQEKTPDASTISANRRRRFRDNNIPEKIFDEILKQCVEKGLVKGKVLNTDSTHVKAKANKHKKKTVEVSISPREYIERLDAAINADRERLGKKPFERDDAPDNPGADEDDSSDLPKREIQQSTTDPDSGQLHKEGKPDGFHYSEHRTVDSANNVIVNVRVTAANVSDIDPMPEILRDVERRLGSLPEKMVMDAGYHNARTAHLLAENGIQGVIGYRRHTHKGEHMGKWRFHYDPDLDVYRCPNQQLLTHRTTNRDGYREYWSDSKICAGCPYRKECFSEKAKRRLVTRHVWQDDLDQVTEFTKTEQGKRIYSRRKELIERSFAEAKELHGFRTARMLGLKNMSEQSFLTAAVQNMKRLVRFMASIFTRLPYIIIYNKPAGPYGSVGLSTL